MVEFTIAMCYEYWLELGFTFTFELRYLLAPKGAVPNSIA
jgi:hypothetical protein